MVTVTYAQQAVAPPPPAVIAAVRSAKKIWLSNAGVDTEFLRNSTAGANGSYNETLRCNQLQIVRLIRNRLVVKLTHDLRPLQKEDPLHLMPIFLDRANPMFEDRTLQPPRPNRRLQQRQRRMYPRKRKHRKLVHLRLRIADPLHIPNAVVIEERLCALRR